MTTPAPVSLAAVALELARSEIGVREVPPGSNRGAIVDSYAPRCVRLGRWLDVRGDAWCSRFVSEITWRAWASIHGLDGYGDVPLLWTPKTLPPEPPFRLRAAVSELVSDAQKAGAWRDVVAAETPQPGDVLIWGRDGQSPVLGGHGHCGFADGAGAICGNDGDGVRRVDLPHTAGPWVGWIRLG